MEVFRLDADDPIKGLLQKSQMFQFSPFRETLYLDADTVVLGRLDFAFLKAQEFGLACCICECPWDADTGEFMVERLNTTQGFYSLTNARSQCLIAGHV